MLGLVILAGAHPAFGVTGTLGAHDPSDLIKDGNTYYYFATGNGIVQRHTTDLNFFTAGPSIFAAPPAWTTSAVPGFTGTFWAPHVTYMNNQFNVYYAVSTFGSQVSAIGMVSSPTLNPSSANYQWTDHGPVITSSTGDPYNAIDPSVFTDTDGKVYLTFGSFWNGIYIIQLDPTTGMRSPSSSLLKRIAYNSTIEASYLIKRGIYYYLFVNWGYCCQGVNSTYNIRMGRSTSPTGPFLDQNGIDMVNGGGTLFLGTSGRYIGPGQIGDFSQSGIDYFSFHYYDGNNNGAPTYDLRTLYWTGDNWPSAVPVPEPAAAFLLTAAVPLLLLRRR